MVFCIGDIYIDLKGENEYFTRRSKLFRSPLKIDNYDIELEMAYRDEIPFYNGEVIVDDNPVWIKKAGLDSGYYILVSDRSRGVSYLSMEAASDWSKVKITMRDFKDRYIEGIEKTKWCEFHSFLYAGIAFRNRLIKLGGLQIHSSSIDYEGNGLIFSAPSGTGKSTHTRLWKELYGDSVSFVNDDRPAVRYIDGKAMLCGTPWSGTSNLFTNAKVPLKCIVMLERSNENKIYRLNKEKAISLLMPRCFMPYYDTEMMEEAMCVLERVIEDIPILHLQCRPDHEAVELVRKCMN